MTSAPAAARNEPAIATVESAAHHAEWDAFLANTAGGDVVQSAGWGRVKHASGMEIHRVLVRCDGEIAGGAQLVARPIGPFGSVAYVPYGPVIAPQASDPAVGSLVELLLRQARRAKARALFVQPPESGDRVSTVLRSKGCRGSSFEVAPSATVRVDVQLEPELLLDRMSKHARREFRRSQRDAVEVRRAVREDLPSFYELYACTAARQRFRPLPFAYLQSLWDELHPVGQVEIFLAEVDGVDVAANLVTRFAGVVTGRLLGFDPARLSRRLRPNEALIWAIIQWASEAGAKTLDVGGIDRAEALELSTPTTWHKTKLGGEAVVLPEPLELISNRALRSAFGTIRSSALLERIQTWGRTSSPTKAGTIPGVRRSRR